MNTSLKITQLSNSKAAYRAKEIVRNITNLDFDADIVIVKNEKIEAKFLNKNQKSKRIQLQKNLHIYKKRLQKAIDENKEKSILTNSKKIESIENELSKTKVPVGRKKNFIEISLQLTNSNIDPKKFDNYEMFYEFIKTNKFTKDLDIKVAAYHKDQHSPHLQCLFDVSNINNFADYLRAKTDYEINDTREIYSIIQNDFHNFVSNIYEIDEMHTGRKYMSINKYKIFTDKLEKLKKFINKVKKSLIFDIRNYFKNKNNDDFIAETDKMYEEFLAGKNEKDEQMYEKQEKSDLRANSEPKNDTKQTSKQRKQR